MEQQRGECCVDSYAGGAYDMSKVDLIMLKFRPIAPKPASTDGSISGGGIAGSVAVPVKSGRPKRRKTNNCGRRRKASPENTDSGGPVKTLPLLPEEPGAREGPKPLWLRFGGGDGMVTPAAATAAQSWVKVECVTDTWEGGWSTDEERTASLDLDTCPGFISDGGNKVRWTNAAFGRMVAAECVVVVVERGVVLPVGCAGFTCRVRVVTCGEKDKTVPCDVWRMDCGGFAWRLDTAAALSLWFGH